MATRKLEIQITGEDRGASHLFGNVADQADRTESRMSGWAKGIAGAIGAAFAVDTILDWGSTLINAAEESQAVTRQTEAVIASMGGASKITADEVAELAEAISLKTGLDDEMIQSGENVLLTFGNIRNEVGAGNDIFTQATRVATDMSVAMGQDLQSSITQVGKALNDPIAGISALSRVGVQFSTDQVAMIQSLVETGDMLGAQKVILDELTRQFGGSAEAQATASDKLSVAWGNIQEQLGTALLPLFEKVATWLAETLPGAVEAARVWIQDHEAGIQKVIDTMAAWADGIGKVIGFLGALIGRIADAIAWVQRLADKIAGLPVIGNVLEGGGLAREGNLSNLLTTKGAGRNIPKFDRGGTLVPGINIVDNATGRPEPLVPIGMGRGGDTIIVNVSHQGLLDHRGLIDAINEGMATGHRLQSKGRGL